MTNDVRTHPQVAALEQRELRVGLIAVDLIVVIFLPLFVISAWRETTGLSLAVDIAAWTLDLASLVVILRSGRLRLARTLTLSAMTLLVGLIFFLDVLSGYAYVILLTVPPSLAFVGGKTLSTVLNLVYAAAFALGIYGVLPVPWMVPQAPVVRFTIAATYAILGALVVMIVRARAESYQTLMWTATHDPETGLPNLSTLPRDAAQGESAALLLAFRGSESLSSRFGIEVVQSVRSTLARRVHGQFEAVGQVFQFSESSVLVLLPGFDQPAVESLLWKSLPVVTAEVETHEVSLQPDLSVACTLVDAGTTAQDTIRDLVLTLPVSAERAANTSVWFTPGIREDHDLRVRTGDKLVEAVERGLLRTVYQPILYSSGAQTPDAEVLVRWTDDELGEIPPARFVPIAEERGLIPALTEAVIRSSWHELGEALKQGTLGTLWINISPIHLRSDQFARQFAQAFAGNSVSPDYYSVELTEGALVDEQIVSSGTLEGLRESGFRLSIDDFGTGYSNLDYLRRFDVDRVKIDRSFVSSALEDPKALTICQAILSLASSLGLGTVAEGVETLDICSTMRGMGVDACQGYFTGVPMSSDELLAYLHVGIEGRTVNP